MHNDLYPDAVIGCLKARTVPANVNTTTRPAKFAELSTTRTASRHLPQSLARSSPTSCRRRRPDLLISVDDGSDASELPGAITLDEALAQGDTTREITASP
jgi:fatty-acyl-CoA synthase